jgi:protein-S-isoprenylcysteine O-methyltransferase Ste14
MKTPNNPSTKKHNDRDDLIGEHKWGDAGQVVLLILFLIIWILDSFVFNYSTFLATYVPLYFRIPLGILILIYALWFARSGLRIVFGEKREKPEVIRKGVFSKVRHPIYLGAILLYFGMILFTFSLISVVLWTFIILFYIWISKYEEKILSEYFGKEYLDYKKEVPMLFPKLFK